MARNEEKQYGKLNRLWLQKEKEEGRIKDVHSRPKLSTLNSVAAVKRWIPSIKDEIEYCLQQSQLSHYPERKIAEFKLHIEKLEKEYKCFLNKLRALDPAHKHHPWTPRAYTKRRCEVPDAPSGKRLCTSEPAASSNCETDVAQENQSSSGRVQQPSMTSTSGNQPSQDQPLAFDQMRLAVAVAVCRGPVGGPQETAGLSEVLFSGLPNLQSSPLALAQAQARAPPSDPKEEPDKPLSPQSAPQSMADVLGLSCYSSSDEDS
ncbi:hypothetical protein ACEWY4_014033 [Coilia grayii]|uniref:Uncharacterized protein n=1 Tax=Coilia grayii TaxID=363190 RepID=A0ABD1JRA1_9TELE